jgi:hypothetical protein
VEIFESKKRATAIIRSFRRSGCAPAFDLAQGRAAALRVAVWGLCVSEDKGNGKSKGKSKNNSRSSAFGEG